MFSNFSDNWWLLVVRGVLALLFGVLALFWPGLTLLALVLLFGVYALLDGCTAIASAVSGQRTGHWWSLILEGMVGIGAGVAALVWPGITAIVLLAIIALWAIITGIFEILAAVRLRQQIEGEWALGVAGVLSFLFGVLLILMPSTGALALVWLIGAYAIFFGLLLIMVGMQLRERGREQRLGT